MSAHFSFYSIIEDCTAFKRAKSLAIATECSKGVLRAQEVKSAVQSNDSVVEDIYNMVKDSNGHLYALSDSAPDRETYLKLPSYF